MTFLWLKSSTAEHCGSFSTDFDALYIRLLFQCLHLYFANKHDGNRVSLSGKHSSMQILLSVTEVLICLFFTWVLCICLFPSLSHHWLSRGYMKTQEQIQPPGSGANLLSHGHGCKTEVTPALQVPQTCYMDKPSWAQSMLLPPLRLMFHFRAAVPALKLHYCTGAWLRRKLRCRGYWACPGWWRKLQSEIRIIKVGFPISFLSQALNKAQPAISWDLVITTVQGTFAGEVLPHFCYKFQNLNKKKKEQKPNHRGMSLGVHSYLILLFIKLSWNRICSAPSNGYFTSYIAFPLNFFGFFFFPVFWFIVFNLCRLFLLNLEYCMP